MEGRKKKESLFRKKKERQKERKNSQRFEESERET